MPDFTNSFKEDTMEQVAYAGEILVNLCEEARNKGHMLRASKIAGVLDAWKKVYDFLYSLPEEEF